MFVRPNEYQTKYILDLLHLDRVGIRPNEIRPNGYKPYEMEVESTSFGNDHSLALAIQIVGKLV